MSQAIASAAVANTNVNRLNASFTITGFQVANGVSEAIGILSADDVITNTPVTIPIVLNGILAGKANLLAGLSPAPSPAGLEEFIPPPQLSSNLCTILAISIEFIDITIPGLGLNVHVNQLLLAVRADRETRLGDVLCTLLGEDGALNPASNNTLSSSPKLGIRLENNRVVLDATGPATLQSTTTLADPVSWKDVLAIGPAPQTLIPSGTTEFFRLVALSQVSRGGFTLGRVNGVFTVADYKAVNGATMAAGWLTGNVTDPSGTTEVGMFTNFPVRVPVSGVLSGSPIPAGFINDPVILPQLSTNTCSLLGIVIGAIDITIPGLGLNLHVNELSIVARADRETTIGNLLCTLLGDDLLGAATLASSSGPQPAGLTEIDSSKSVLTTEQLRGLVGILLGPGLPAVPSIQLTSGSNPGKNSKKADRELVQDLVQRVIQTMELSSSPKLKGKKDKKQGKP